MDVAATESSSPFVNIATEVAAARRVGGRLGKALAVYQAGKAAYEIGKKAHSKLEARRTYSFTVYATDELFDSVQEWLVNLLPAETQRSLAVHTGRWSARSSAYDEPILSTATARRAERVLRFALDAQTTNRVDVDGHRVKVEYDQPKEDMSDERKRAWYQSQVKITITATSPAGRDAVRAHLTQLHESRMATANGPRFRLASRWGGWSDRSDLPTRSIDTIVLPDGQMERLISHLDGFFNDEADYARTGTPYHTGILLSGPAGTGKTSIFRALAAHFNLDLYLLPLADLESDADLMRTVADVPAGSLLLIEDADVYSVVEDRDDGPTDSTGKSKKRRKKADPGPTSATTTLSGLLNSLDGIATPHGLIVGLTTNHLDRLDSAIIRPGRIDIHERIDFIPDADTAQRIIELVTARPFPLRPNIAGKKVTPAALVNALRTVPAADGRYGDVVGPLASLGVPIDSYPLSGDAGAVERLLPGRHV